MKESGIQKQVTIPVPQSWLMLAGRGMSKLSEQLASGRQRGA